MAASDVSAAAATIDDLVLAVDVGGTNIKAEILGRDLTSFASGTVRTPRGDAILDAVVTLGERLRAQIPADDRSRLTCVGMAVPGIVDLVTGVAINSVNLEWRETQVVEPVAAGLDLPVVLSHDVAAAGLAEWRHGAGRGTDDLLVVTIGTGIAAAIVSGGRLVTGGLHQGGELGHVVVRPGGHLCACGQRGCVETVASAAAIVRGYQAESGVDVSGAAEVASRLGGDDIADVVWSRAVDALADGLHAACALFAPTRVVVGGGLSEAGASLLRPLRSRMNDTWRLAGSPEVVRAELGSRAGVVGAAVGAWE